MEVDMFFRKPKSVACAVYGNTINPKERRFMEKNRVTKVERHVHVDCRGGWPVSRAARAGAQDLSFRSSAPARWRWRGRFDKILEGTALSSNG
jgi:hypothetical protein